MRGEWGRAAQATGHARTGPEGPRSRRNRNCSRRIQLGDEAEGQNPSSRWRPTCKAARAHHGPGRRRLSPPSSRIYWLLFGARDWGEPQTPVTLPVRSSRAHAGSKCKNTR